MRRITRFLSAVVASWSLGSFPDPGLPGQGFKEPMLVDGDGNHLVREGWAVLDRYLYSEALE
jgi:hypothetical protein